MIKLQPQRWHHTMKNVVSKIAQLVYLHEDENIFRALPLSKEFATLKSVYSKSVFRFLKQYRKTGFWKIDLYDFRKVLNIPESYQSSELDKRVLKPVRTCF